MIPGELSISSIVINLSMHKFKEKVRFSMSYISFMITIHSSFDGGFVEKYWNNFFHYILPVGMFDWTVPEDMEVIRLNCWNFPPSLQQFP